MRFVNGLMDYNNSGSRPNLTTSHTTNRATTRRTTCNRNWRRPPQLDLLWTRSPSLRTGRKSPPIDPSEQVFNGSAVLNAETIASDRGLGMKRRAHQVALSR